MAYKRKRYISRRRSRISRFRRRFRRATRRPSRGIKRKEGFFRIKRRFDGTGTGPANSDTTGAFPNDVTVAANTTIVLGFNTQFNFIETYAELAALFTHYRINCVVMKVFPSKGTMNSGTAVDLSYPILSWARDNSNGLTVSPSQMRQYQSFKQHVFSNGNPLVVKWYPKVPCAVYQSAISSGYNYKSVWVSTADNAVDHYFGKVMLQNYNTNTAMTFQFDWIFYVSLKNVK